MMFGPKKTSLLACVPICFAWVMMCLADDIYMIYASRMLTGIFSSRINPPNAIVFFLFHNELGIVKEFEIFIEK